VLAGILIGLMVVKPHLAVLAPLVLLRRFEWKAIAAAAVTVIVLVGLSAAIFGTELWVTYLTETTRLQAAMVDDTDSFFITMMPTVLPSLALLGASIPAGTVVQIIVGLGAIGLLLWKLPKDSRDAGLATAAATFLVLPYAFAYDMTAAGLGALLLFRRALDDKAGAAYTFAALGAALVPMLILYTNFFGYPVSPPLIAFQLAAALSLWPRQTKPA
jgi:hypothetical protein